jgi:hypothetical protein
MNDQILSIMDRLNVSDYSVDEVEHANAQLEAVSTVLDALGADYSAELKGSLIEIVVEPRISYNKAVFQIDVEKRTIDVAVRGY